MTETLAYEYSSESTQQELFDGYQHDRVQMVFKNLRIHVLSTKVASALEGLNINWLITDCCMAVHQKPDVLTSLSENLNSLIPNSYLVSLKTSCQQIKHLFQNYFDNA